MARDVFVILPTTAGAVSGRPAAASNAIRLLTVSSGIRIHAGRDNRIEQTRARMDADRSGVRPPYNLGYGCPCDPDQEAFIRQAIESGRFHRPEDAVEEALNLWESRERIRAELLAAVDQTEASLARGEGYPLTPESMRQLAEDVKRRGRARLEAERQGLIGE